MNESFVIHPGRKWLIIRRWIQAAALLLFAASVLLVKPGGWDPSQANFIARLSPYSMVLSLLSSRRFLAGSTLSLILLISSLVMGRAWCGWLCPLGTLLDIFSFSKWKKNRKPLSDRWRSVKYFLLITALVAAVFTNLTLLFLDPITISIRTFAGVIFPIFDRLIYWLEQLLIQVPFLSNAIGGIDQWLRPAILPSTPKSVQYFPIFLGSFLVLIGLNLFAERFWCRYLCPLGALLGLGSKISLIKRKVSSSCTQCGLCEKRCPTGTIRQDHSYDSDPSECILCLNCFPSCKNSQLEVLIPPRTTPLQSYDPNRRIFLSSLGTAALGTFILQSDWFHLSNSPFMLRPPGSQPDTFLSTCIRCGLCEEICPTEALQVDLSAHDPGGFAAPILVPRTGYCDYGCNACGQICPVKAIPSLSLEEKRQRVIGKATINRNRCLAWAEHTPCIVCEEMCPVPEKAIKLTQQVFTDESGTPVEILLPHVQQHRCIGCGICEYKCPVVGEAAIRVFSL